MRRVAGELWSNLPTLLGANLLWLAFTTPYLAIVALGLYLPSLVVVPFTTLPAFVGLLYCAGRIARGEPVSPLDVLRGLRASYWRSCGLGLLTVLLLAGNQFSYHVLSAANAPVWLVVLWALQLSLLILLGLLHVHTFALIALYDASVGAALRNAFVLSFGHPWPTVGLFSLTLLLSYTLVIGPGVVIIVPAVLAMFLVHNTLMLAERRRIRGNAA